MEEDQSSESSGFLEKNSRAVRQGKPEAIESRFGFRYGAPIGESGVKMGENFGRGLFLSTS
jgi:hypothetical protein